MIGGMPCALTSKRFGLPHSPHKLHPSAFQPVIDRCDMYLAGWCTLLLSHGGRLILLSAVLDSLPTYFMMCFSLPVSVLEEIDKRRCIFFWSNGDTFSGAKCLVVWDRVCMPKQAGGLGVKNLRVQNFCLMLKFAFKFLHSPPPPLPYFHRREREEGGRAPTPCPIWFGQGGGARHLLALLPSLH